MTECERQIKKKRAPNGKNNKHRSKYANHKKSHKGKGNDKNYFYCHKEGRYRRYCPNRKKKDQGNKKEELEADFAEENYESSDALQPM